MVWLDYLRHHHPGYRCIVIDKERLSQLPEDGNVLDAIPQSQVEAADVGAEEDQEAEPDLEDAAAVPDLLAKDTEHDALRSILAPQGRRSTSSSFPTYGTRRSHALLSLAFPCLFPDGRADFVEPRLRSIEYKKYIEHAMRWHDGRFARHPTFRFVAFNTLMRPQARARSKFFVKQQDGSREPLTREQLIEALEHSEDPEAQALINSITRKRQNLEAYTHDLGCPGAFITFSPADLHWRSLYQHMPRYETARPVSPGGARMPMPGSPGLDKPRFRSALSRDAAGQRSDQAAEDGSRGDVEMEDGRIVRVEIEKLQRLLKKARREKEEAKAREEEAKKTTLEEYLYNCHFHLYTKLGFADKSKSSTGLATRVDNKYYPKWLRPWNTFASYQRHQHFDEIRRVCGATVSYDPAGNENAVEYFEKIAVEVPVREILAPVWDQEGSHGEHRITMLRFSHNVRDFTQPSDSRIGDDHPNEERQERRRPAGTTMRIASTREFQPPPAAHKFAAAYLKATLAKEKLFSEVIARYNSNKYKSNAKLQEQEREETRIAMALTQVFDYMVWQYCTQACLLSLKRGWDLDANCPNVPSHRTAEGGIRHPIDAGEFTRLVGERLRRNPYRNCKALDGQGKVGATGVLFKLELAPYGYTFVGKGTLSDHLYRLEHESRIYAHLDKLQGEVVPVHFDIVRLARVTSSWRGKGRSHDANVVGRRSGRGGGVPDLAAEVRRSSQAVWAEGVDHGDEREPNLLWNDERRRVMLVDFDRANLLPAPKHKQLFHLSRDKRKRQRDGFGARSRKRGLLRDHLQVVE
ncbi:ATP-dependent DNA helicase PIF1 [Hirsutella rhossiliensis]|uniref:ATP-dependent DNA helicase PIF1 n=1 Tax=Hirsutella rhossiliensis TaxID=111463 RepID=A0A9P8MNN4_9HYPO|nr:ATP-dependent DNA helicase PIF1 [Hirsutella rhossiliensis]KAH0958465.1 ATP-dependent DNA helicase PIF1 [Hirsutella rhossiliensis]